MVNKMDIEKILTYFLLFLQNKFLSKLQVNNRFSVIFNFVFINTIIAIVSALIMSIAFTFIEFVTGIDLKESTKNNVLNKYSKFDFFFIGVLLVPILEELCFRYPLRPSKISISISFGLLLGVFMSKWLFLNWLISTRLEISLALSVLFYFVLKISNFNIYFSKKQLFYFSNFLLYYLA